MGCCINIPIFLSEKVFLKENELCQQQKKTETTELYLS